LPQRPDFDWGSLLARVSPTVPFVVDERGDLGVAEPLPKRWHRSGVLDSITRHSLEPKQDGANVGTRIRFFNGLRRRKRRENPRKALTVRLMAAGAVLLVELRSQLLVTRPRRTTSRTPRCSL